MRKRMFSSLVLVAVVGLVGCTDSTKPTPPPAPTSTLVSIQVDGGDAALSQANSSSQSVLKLLQ